MLSNLCIIWFSFNPRPASLPGDPLRRQMTIHKRIFGAFARTSFRHQICIGNLDKEILKGHVNQWLA